MSKALIEKLQEQRAGIWEGMKSVLDKAAEESRDLSVEERSEWEARNVDLDRIDERVKAVRDGERRAADAEAAFADLLAKPAEREQPGDRGTELRAFMSGEGPRSFEVRTDSAFGTAELRVLSKLTSGAGGATVPTSFYNRLIAHMIEVSGVLQAGPTLLTTNSGEKIQIPKTTAHSSAALIAEAGTITPSDPAFTQAELDAYKYATLFQMSSELITDTGVDLEGYAAMAAGRAVGNLFGQHLVTGSGSSQPQGVAGAASVGVTGGAGVAGAFTYENLVDLYYSVISPYRASGSCGWMLRDASMAGVRKLKDGAGQYIFTPGIGDTPDTILGKRVTTDPNVAAVALGARSVLFGDFSQYFVRQVNGIRFERSVDFAFNSDLVTFRAILRGDGDLIDTTGAVKCFVGNAA